jgi:hypothetical protein
VQKKIASAVLTAACAALCSTAQAAPVLMDFEGGLPDLVKTNLVLNGFRVSPLCHFDFLNFGRPSSTGVAMGFDMSGCLDPGSTNANYLGLGVAGAERSLVFIDLAGQQFDLTSLSGTTDLKVLSSKGGSFLFPILPLPSPVGEFRSQSFSGAQWTGLTWIAFEGGGGGVPSTPLDNILFNVNAVSEPTSLALVCLSLAGVGLFGRRPQRRQVLVS